MAAGDKLNITNSLIASFGTAKVLAWATADQETDATAQKFIYTPTGKPQKVVFIIYSKAASKLTVTLTAGDNVFGQAAKAVSIPATAGTYALQVETGAYAQSDGTIELSVLPAASKDLVNDHALTVAAIELI